MLLLEISGKSDDDISRMLSSRNDRGDAIQGGDGGLEEPVAERLRGYIQATKVPEKGAL